MQIKAYDAKVITIEKIRAVEHTNMIEFVEDEYEKFRDDPQLQAEYKVKQPVFAARKEAIFNIIDHEPEAVQKVSAFFASKDQADQLGGQQGRDILAHHGITLDALEAYYQFAKFKYECGMYTDAEGMLGHYLDAVAALTGTSSVSQLTQTLSSAVSTGPALASYQGALWGRLACRIVQGRWGEAGEALAAVKESIDLRTGTPADQLKQRAYLLHWSLFVYLNQRDGIEALVDLVSERYYLQCIENLAPWLLRYYAVALVLCPSRRRTGLGEVLGQINALGYLYADPMTEFLGSLDSFDFDSAQAKLADCQALVKADFFLQVHAERFMAEARMLIAEMYCSVHATVDLRMLADKLSFTDEEAEKWTADLVRGGNLLLDAKIDSSSRQVIIAPPAAPGHKAVVDMTKEMTARSAVLSANLEALAKDQAFYVAHRA